MMEYHTAYFYRNSGENHSPLSLHQIYHKKKQLPVVFACVGWGAADLTDWFYAEGFNLCLRKEEHGIYSVGHKLYRQLKAKRRKEKGENHSLSGVLGVGKRLCIFSVSEAPVRVLNLHNGCVSCKELHLMEQDGQGIGIQYATMDNGVGVLLETEEFRQKISTEQLQEYLKGKIWADKGSLEQSLQELGKEGESKGGTRMAAVLLAFTGET